MVLSLRDNPSPLHRLGVWLAVDVNLTDDCVSGACDGGIDRQFAVWISGALTHKILFQAVVYGERVRLPGGPPSIGDCSANDRMVGVRFQRLEGGGFRRVKLAALL